MLVGLVRAGLATSVMAGSPTIEVDRVGITDAGRQAIGC
jgi:hypothetical protein